LGGSTGTQWDTDVAQYDTLLPGGGGFCSEAPNGGTPVENIYVGWVTYNQCDPDCAQDQWCTGAPHGDIINYGSITVKERCHQDNG
jgi:hypothetical protein